MSVRIDNLIRTGRSSHTQIGQANYAAAKSAVIGLSKTIAKEWGPFGVRANTIAFGYIMTRYLVFVGNLLLVFISAD